ncbi:hypothetical protein ACIP10_34665 [Streptomyces galbus]|uniref:MmyB family transcriptional regulator n=1 Tax=Streptomyces galbus TaxID=33898 RepID=UPI0037F16B31
MLCDFAAEPEPERNYVRMVFTDPVMRDIYPAWEDVARTDVEVLRMEAGMNPTGPGGTTGRSGPRHGSDLVTFSEHHCD